MRKQIISSVFRRQKNQNSTAAASAPANVDTDTETPVQNMPSPAASDSELSIGRINIIPSGEPSSIKVIQFASNGKKYCANAIDGVDTPAATVVMKTPDRGDPVSRDNYEAESTAFNVDSKPFGTDPHLSAREQIWYKNQMYLLAKQQQQQAVSKSTSIYDGSVYTHVRRYRNRYSPSGVDQFEEDSGVIQRDCCDSYDGSNDDYNDDDDDDITRTTLSRKFPDDEDSCTTQFTAVLDDDTRTYSSSLLFEEDTSCSDSNEIFDGLALDSAISGCTPATESESLFSALDDGASMSYVFELVDDGGKQRRKYQLGVGHNPDFSGRRKYPRSTTKARRANNVSTTKTITAWPQVSCREKNSTVDANSVVGDAECPLLQVLKEEVIGTFKDAKLALDQVLHAFCISPDNVDQITDEISVARLELRDLCQKRGSPRGQAMNSFRYWG